MHRLARSAFRLSLIAMFVLAPQLLAQAPAAHPALPSDAAWARQLAAGCSANVPCPEAGGVVWDPHFLALLRHSLPQREGWWVNGYGGTSSVTNAVTAFLGLPDAPRLDDGRYLTLTGCVPHLCTSKGMVWIDTGTHPSTVIFVGEDLVAGGVRGQSGYHLYLYTSRELATYYAGRRPIGRFAPQFLSSLARWHTAALSADDGQKIVLATLVWPNGATHDLFWNDLLSPPPASAQPAGAKP